MQPHLFRGEGVVRQPGHLRGNQKLGVIGAKYNFYTYPQRGGQPIPAEATLLPADICQRNNFLKIQCTGNTPDLRYGFYLESGGSFRCRHHHDAAPEGENLQATYGFAALPDSAGNCPSASLKVRPYVAQPSSIIQGSLAPPIANNNNPPSSFINTGNTLNNTVVEEAAPSNFVVSRQPNQTPCGPAVPLPVSPATARTQFSAETQQAQSVAYTPLTPVVCAIPKSLLSGLF